MFEVELIVDFEDPRLAPFKTLRAQFDHLNGGFFVADGEKVVRRLLESSCEVISVLLTPHWQKKYEPWLAARPEKITLFSADHTLQERLTGYSLFQGMLGLARVPAPVALNQLLVGTEPQLFLAADGINNSENVGTVVRNLAALGGQALIVGETSAHPYLRRAVRSSMGSIFKVPYSVSSHLVETLGELRRSGVRCVAAHPRSDQRCLWDVDFTGPTCLVLGAEGPGLRPEVVAVCDEVVAIPMSNAVDSLNVANAAAVFLGEVQRQRWAVGQRVRG